MNNKVANIIYWVSTILMCGIFLFSANMYFSKTEMVRGFFEALQYPPYLVYPLAIAKVLGVVTVLVNKSKVLKEWAYAGFFFDACLATAAHYTAGHQLSLSVAAIALVVISRVFWTLRNSQKE